MGSFVNWLAFSYFTVGAFGGIFALAQWISGTRGHSRRVEVHHRYHSVPVFYGPNGAHRGDMAQHQADPDDAA